MTDILRCAACGRILKRAAAEAIVDSRRMFFGPACARSRKLLPPVQRRVFSRSPRAKASAQMAMEFV